MSWIQLWTKHVHPLVLTIVCWCSITLVAFDVFAPERWKLGMAAHASWITLVLLSLFVLAYLEKERVHPRLRQAAQLGIKEIYRSRSDQEQIREYEDLLSNAKLSLFIVGITLKDLSHEQKDHLLKKAADGCRIELLMLSPEFRDNDSPVLDPVAASIGREVLRMYAGKSKSTTGRRRSKMSVAARGKIAAAQRARWAKARKGSQPAVVGVAKTTGSAPVKHTMSTAARKKIAAFQRARWAKLKAGKKAA